VLLKPVYDLVILLVLRTGIQETLILLMLVDNLKKAFVGTVGAIKDFPLPVEDEFLEVKGHRLGDTEVLGILGYIYFQFFTGTEKMVDCVPAGENNGGIMGNIHFLLPELLGRNRIQADEWKKLHLHLVLAGKFVIGRFVGFRPGLRD
jgi:hypothetical protein